MKDKEMHCPTSDSLWHVTVVMIDISLISEDEQIFMYSLGICVS